MELILWRHAQAEDHSLGLDDMKRQLTAKGHAQAKAMAKWLKPRLPEGTRILVSPAQRTRQTADALHLPYEVIESIAPEATVDALLQATNWPHAGPVLLVGHQPTLGLLASLLLAGHEQTWPIKKGAIWWFKNDGQQISLHAVLAAQML